MSGSTDIKRAIYERRAIRDYTDEKLNQSVIVELIEAATQAPSAMNQQSWHFSVIQDRDMMARISLSCKRHLLENPGAGLISPHFGELLDDPTFNIFYNAPTLIVIANRTENRWAREDCALAAGTLMLAASGAGLGTCWIGLAQGWLATEPGRSLLDLPANYVPLAPIIVGHQKNSPSPVGRKTPTIHWIGTQYAADEKSGPIFIDRQ